MDSRVVRGDLRMAGQVLRYSSWPTLTQQTVASHCWHVARVYAAVFGEYPPGEVAAYIQNHDSAELITGDAPFPVKRDNPDLKAAFDRVEANALRDLGVRLPTLPDVERHRVKVCDLLEMMSFGMMEVEMGNRLAVPVVERTHETALSYAFKNLDHADVKLVYDYVERENNHHDSVISGAAQYADAAVRRDYDRRFG